MPFEMRQEECDLLAGLLEKEMDDVRSEIHHTDNHDYKESLKKREKFVRDLLLKFKA